jgi:metallo-beta-lactamase family protein
MLKGQYQSASQGGNQMNLQFLGAAGTVTGSCYLLNTARTRIMIDCGMFQGPREVKERNYGDFPVPPRTVDCVLLTHAHIDHSGMLPKLVKHGFNGKIYASAATVDLCQVLLPDSGHIQEMEVGQKNRRSRRAGRPLIEPVYTIDDAYKCLSYFERVKYREVVEIAPDVRVRFVDAGHILGSAIIEVWAREGESEIKLVFSGDIGNKDQPLFNEPSPIAEADYVIMESTYGKRLHQHCRDEAEMLREVIWEAYQKGGNLIIPAFAVERTQDLLYHLHILMKEKKMPPMPVYIDSPLASAATAIFQKYLECRDTKGCDPGEETNPLSLPGLQFTQSTEESILLNRVKGAIIISASGMCEAGRIRHHLRHNLWRPESTVLFVGYQAEGTLGRLILEGKKVVRIFGEEIAVKAAIRSINCYSAHADQAGLLEWAGSFTRPPREIFVTHGEAESADTLAGLLKTRLGLNASVPDWRQAVELLPAKAAKVAPGPIQSAHAALSTKIQNLLDKDLDPAYQEQLLRQMAQLEQLIDQGIKQAAQ